MLEWKDPKDIILNRNEGEKANFRMICTDYLINNHMNVYIGHVSSGIAQEGKAGGPVFPECRQ